MSGATTHDPRVYVDIEIGLSVNVLNLVDPRLQFSVLEDGAGVAGRVQFHRWQGKVDGEHEQVAMLVSCADVRPPHLCTGVRYDGTDHE